MRSAARIFSGMMSRLIMIFIAVALLYIVPAIALWLQEIGWTFAGRNEWLTPPIQGWPSSDCSRSRD